MLVHSSHIDAENLGHLRLRDPWLFVIEAQLRADAFFGIID